MIYDTTTETQLTLLRSLLERYGRHASQGNNAKLTKAKDQINLVVRRLKKSHSDLPGYVREIE